MELERKIKIFTLGGNHRAKDDAFNSAIKTVANCLSVRDCDGNTAMALINSLRVSDSDQTRFRDQLVSKIEDKWIDAMNQSCHGFTHCKDVREFNQLIASWLPTIAVKFRSQDRYDGCSRDSR